MELGPYSLKNKDLCWLLLRHWGFADLARTETEPEGSAAASYIPLIVSNAALAIATALYPKEVTRIQSQAISTASHEPLTIDFDSAAVGYLSKRQEMHYPVSDLRSSSCDQILPPVVSSSHASPCESLRLLLQAADCLFGGLPLSSSVIPLMRLVSAGFATAGFVSLALKVESLHSTEIVFKLARPPLRWH